MCLRAPVQLTLLPVLGLLALGGAASAAPSGRLALVCQDPAPTLARCQLTGQGFRRRERVTIAYEVVVQLLSDTQRRATYRQTATTDRRGTLFPPAVQFALPRQYRSYNVSVQLTEVIISG